MPIFKYRKVSDPLATYTLQVEQGQRNQELCEIDGVTYHFVDGDLAAQPDQITVEVANVTAELRDAICKNSRAVQMINEYVVSQIRARYSIDDEMKLLRTRSSAEWDAYNDWVEACRADGKAKKQALGL